MPQKKIASKVQRNFESDVILYGFPDWRIKRAGQPPACIHRGSEEAGGGHPRCRATGTHRQTRKKKISKHAGRYKHNHNRRSIQGYPLIIVYIYIYLYRELSSCGIPLYGLDFGVLCENGHVVITGGQYNKGWWPLWRLVLPSHASVRFCEKVYELWISSCLLQHCSHNFVSLKACTSSCGQSRV